MFDDYSTAINSIEFNLLKQHTEVPYFLRFGRFIHLARASF